MRNPEDTSHFDGWAHEPSRGEVVRKSGRRRGGFALMWSPSTMVTVPKHDITLCNNTSHEAQGITMTRYERVIGGVRTQRVVLPLAARVMKDIHGDCSPAQPAFQDLDQSRILSVVTGSHGVSFYSRQCGSEHVLTALACRIPSAANQLTH